MKMKPKTLKPKTLPAAGEDFKTYLLTNKKLILSGAAVSFTLFALLKVLFPDPDFFLDSYSYVEDAIKRPDITYRPRGYANFLSILHSISSAPLFTVFVQFIVFLLSSVFFVFSSDYLFGLPQKLKAVVFYLAIVNPILLLQTNLVSSDSLFCSLTVTWFTFCLWAIRRPNWFVLLAQVVLLLFCFHVRYTAMYFPAIAVAFFLFSKGNLVYKMAGIVLSCGLIYHSVEMQKEEMYRVTYVRMLSAFSGWQIANNVLCYYKEIDVRKEDLPTFDAENIDEFVKKFINDHYIEGNNIGTYYLWEPKSPLKYYLAARKERSGNSYFLEWCICAELFNDYAWAIIKQYPMAYVRYFMGGNLKHYVYPNPEALDNYDRWHSAIPAGTKTWFGFNKDHLECRFPNLQEKIIAPYPAISFIINIANILVLALLLFFIIKYRKRADRDTLRLFFSWGTFYFSFVLFCLFSTIVLLRYLDPLFMLGLVMPFVLVERILRLRAK
jgi:hypothetical protein